MNNKVQMSVRLRKIRNGNNGEKGQSVFKAIVFKRIAPGTAVTAPMGGSFANGVWTPPSGWSDGIPAEDGNPCYMSTRIFTSDGRAPQDASWSFPVLNSDTAGYDVCFSSKPTWPTPPSSHGTQNDSVWHEIGTENDKWMAQSWCRNGVWSDWVISKIKGEDGASATIKGTAIAHYSSMAEFDANYEDFGVYLVDDGSQPKTLTVDTTMSSQNANVGDGWFVGTDLWVCTENGWKNAGNFKGDRGPTGDAAKYVVVTADQAFVYKDNFTGAPTPTSIIISSSLYGGLTSRAWSYKRSDQANFSTISGQTGATLTVSPSNPTYWGSTNAIRSCTFRCTSNGYYDEITIIKVSSGKDANAYTIVLTNESHTFTGENGHALAGSAECGIIAYKNDERVGATITGYSELPTGMSFVPSDNGTENAKFTIGVDTTLTEKCGTLEVSITVDGKEFTKIFSWSLSLKGSTGVGTEGRSAFEISITPLVFNTNSKGEIRYSDGGSNLNQAHITAKYKGSTALVSAVSVISTYNCSASVGNMSGSSTVNTDVYTVITNIPHTDYDASGNVTTVAANTKYSVPATNGYAVVKVTLAMPALGISETVSVNVPWSVNLNAHFGTLIYNDHLFESTIGSITSDMDEVTAQVSTISQTATQIRLTVGQLSNERRNLIWRSKLNLVDYRNDKGARRVRLTKDRTYLLTVKATPSPALIASQRKASTSGMLTSGGYLRSMIADANQSIGTAILFRSPYTSVRYALFTPAETKEFTISHSDMPKYNQSGGAASTYSQHYHIEWEQLEDVTERLPDNWDSLSADERLELAPMMATPWSLSENEADVNENLLNDINAEFDTSCYTKEEVTLPDGSKVKGFYQNTTSAATLSRDVYFNIPSGITVGNVYTLSFWAKGEVADAAQSILSYCNATLGIVSLTAYYVASETKLYNAYNENGNAAINTRIGNEWRHYAISFTASRNSTSLNPIKVTVCRANGYKFHIAAIKLEEGGRATYGDGDALYQTGIDITNHKIQLTADNVEFRDNQGNFAALIRGEGITARSFIALDSMGMKISSLNESGDGALVQYHPDGVTPKFRFGNDGITCYWGDESDRPNTKSKGDIRWFIGTGGVNGTTDDWIVCEKYQVENEANGFISPLKQNKYLFRAGSSSHNSEYDGTTYNAQRIDQTNRLNGMWAISLSYNMLPIPTTGPDIYFQRRGQSTRTRVYYCRNYNNYSDGKRVGYYAFYYDANKNCVGNTNPNSDYYGTIIVNL